MSDEKLNNDESDLRDQDSPNEASDDPSVASESNEPGDDSSVASESDAANDLTGEAASDEKLTFGKAIVKGLSETIDTFIAFIHAPREIIGINIINVFEGMAYFGILTILMLFMTKNVLVTDAPYVDIRALDVSQFAACLKSENIGGCIDVHASWTVSLYLMIITLSQLFIGGLSDKLGPKRMLGISIFILLCSRIVLALSEHFFAPMGTGIGSVFFIVVCASLLCAAISYGVFNPAVYSITRMYSDEKTSAVSYAMLYAGMNLGAFIIGLLLPFIRQFAGDKLDESGKVIEQGFLAGTNGYSGAFIFIAGLMVIVFWLYCFLIAKSKTKPYVDPKEADPNEPKDETPSEHLTLLERIKRHPLADLKFDFFIFILIPVQTLFAYQNILIPTYLERSYRSYPLISEHYETFSNLNPLIVFLSAPVIAALTAKQDVYKMMIIGTTVMALPSFLLCIDTNPTLFLIFIFIGSIGESMWQPRFLQHVTQIAPKDRMGAYVGIANLPWFMTKFIVGIYVGFFIQGFIPDPDKYPDATQNPQTMWFIFACIAMISPIALLLANKWMNSKKEEDTKVVIEDNT